MHQISPGCSHAFPYYRETERIYGLFKMVPAGPYRLDDLRPMGNGDLVVTIEDESGNKTEQVYPVTTLPTLLRSGEFQYNVAMGKKNNSNELDKAFHSDTGLFWLGSWTMASPQPR